MIIDALTTFAPSPQAITSASTYVSTDNIDLGVARDIAPGETMHVCTTVGTAFAGGTNVTIQVIGSTASNMASPVVLASSPAIPTANLTAGAQFFTTINRAALVNTGYRYLAVQYVSTGTYTAGTINSTIVEDPQDQRKLHASGFAIL